MSTTLRDLWFWRDLHWRKITLLLALAGMEMSWLAPLVMALHPRGWGVWPGWYLLGLASLMALMMAAAHWLSQRQVDSPLFELAILATLVGLAAILLRLVVFGDEPALSLRWLRIVFASADPRRMEALLLLAVLAYLWWRGVTFLQREVGFFVVGYDFRKGVLALVGALILYSSLSGASGQIFVYTFFFFSLMAVAVGRVEDKSQVSGRRGSPFGPEWMAILALCSLAVLGLAAAAARYYSLDGFGALAATVAPAGSLIGRGLGAAALFLLSLLEPLFQWLIDLLRNSLFAGVQPEDLTVQVPPALGELLGEAEGTGAAVQALPPWLDLLVNTVLPGLALVAGLVLLVFWLERRRRQRGLAGEAEWLEHTSGAERAGVGGLIRDGMRRLAALAGLVGQFGLGRRFYAAISVRNVYANLQRLAAQRGFPRHKAQTPNDYYATLLRAFPGQDAPLRSITDAYNAVEYGEAPSSAEELARLRRAWLAVAAASRHTRPPKAVAGGKPT